MKNTLANQYARIGLVCVLGLLYSGKPAIAESNASESIQELFSSPYTAAVNNEDASAFAALFSEDGVRIPPNRPPEGTRDGIRSGVEKVFSKFDFNVKVAVENVESEGDFAWASVRAQGERTDRDSGKIFPLNVRYVVVMKKQDTGWEIFRQSWYPIK